MCSVIRSISAAVSVMSILKGADFSCPAVGRAVGEKVFSEEPEVLEVKYIPYLFTIPPLSEIFF